MNDDVLRETTNVWCASTCTPSSGTPGSHYEAGSPRNPFHSPGSQFRPRHEAAVSVHTSPDALLNGALVASAERMHRVREQLLTPSRLRQPDFGRGSTARRRREERSLSPKAITLPLPTLPCLSKLMLTSISAFKTFCAMWVGVIRFLRACWVTFSSVLDLLYEEGYGEEDEGVIIYKGAQFQGQPLTPLTDATSPSATF
ncbi:hypothetical protein D6D25_06261 [Aureobasidium pullulans]|nr:hypothetical protein D6D25_06261 [Aureobasidium pullulans]